MYKITINDNIVLDDLELNGNNFVSKTIIGNEVFSDLRKVVVENFDDGTVEEIKNPFLIANQVYGNESYFVISSKTEKQLLKEDIDNIQIAMTEMYESLLLLNSN